MAPIQETVFDEIAASVVGIVTKKCVAQFFEKTEDQKVKIISKTIAAAFAAGILGSVLTPSGTIVFLVAGFLAFGHFARTVSIADQAVKGVKENVSLFNEMAETVTNIGYGGAFRRFLTLPTTEAQALTAAKVVCVAATVGLVGSILGFAGMPLFLLSTAFAFSYFTRPQDELAPELPKEQPAALVEEQQK